MAYSKAKRDYNAQYIKENIKRIPLDVQKEHYERIKAAAGVTGESVNGYIKRSIDERMERDGGGTVPTSPQQAAETPVGAGAVNLPPDTLATAQRAAERTGETAVGFIRRAVKRQADREGAHPSSMVVLNPETIRAASVGGFAVGESVREYVIRAVHELVERERPEWDEQTLRFEEAQRIASEKGIACLPPGALDAVLKGE